MNIWKKQYEDETGRMIIGLAASPRFVDYVKWLENKLTCKWREDLAGVWTTDCHNAHIFDEGDPEGNTYKFCPYCGRALVEEKCEEEV